MEKSKQKQEVKKSNNYTTIQKYIILILALIIAAIFNIIPIIIWGMNIPIKLWNILWGFVIVQVGIHLTQASDEEEYQFFLISIITAAFLIFWEIWKIPSWEDINIFPGIWEEII